MFFYEVFPVVSEAKLSILNPHRCFCGTCIISVLEQFRQNVSRALNLLEELVPRACELWILLQLLPSLCRRLTDGLEV
jgi:hypothetical protein